MQIIALTRCHPMEVALQLFHTTDIIVPIVRPAHVCHVDSCRSGSHWLYAAGVCDDTVASGQGRRDRVTLWPWNIPSAADLRSPLFARGQHVVDHADQVPVFHGSSDPFLVAELLVCLVCRGARALFDPDIHAESWRQRIYQAHFDT